MTDTDVLRPTSSSARAVAWRIAIGVIWLAVMVLAVLAPLAFALSDPATWWAAVLVVAAPAAVVAISGRLLSVTRVAAASTSRYATAAEPPLSGLHLGGQKATTRDRDVAALLAGLDAAPSDRTAVRDARFHTVDARFPTLVAHVTEAGGALGSDVLLARSSHVYTVSPRVRTGPLPVSVGRLDLYPAQFEGAPDALVPVSAQGLNDGWRVPSDQAERVDALLDANVVEALNSWHLPHAAVAIRTLDTVALSDGSARVDPVGLAALSSGVHRALRAALRDADTPTNPRIGRLRSDSAARAAQELRGMAGIIAFGVVATAAVVVGLQGEPFDGPLAPATLLWLQAAVLVIVGLTVTALQTGWAGRQRRTAAQVLALAEARGWRYRQRDDALAVRWSVRPFGRVARLAASPSASGASARGAALGVAYLEGDLGPWPLSRVFSSRVAWAALPAGAPPVTIVRRDLAARALAVIDGPDVAVESAAFNEAWAVRATDARAAHALLTPAVIALLLDIADSGVAFTVDGGRVVLWDDGTARDVDLGARLDLVERVSAAMPTFWDRG